MTLDACWLLRSSGYLAEILCPAVAARWLHPLNGKLDGDPMIGSISKAMDANFRLGQIDEVSGIAITPNNHRILIDGHSLSDVLAISWSTGAEIGAPYTRRLAAAVMAYAQDFASPAGMPIGRFAKHVYRYLRQHGYKDATARQKCTVNAERALGALLTGASDTMALWSAWRTQDARHLSYALGASGFSVILYRSPVSSVAVLTGLAASVQKRHFHAYAFQKGIAIACVGRVATVVTAPLGPLALIPSAAVCRYLDSNISDERPLVEQIRDLSGKVWDDMKAGAAQARRVLRKLGRRERQCEVDQSVTLESDSKACA